MNAPDPRIPVYLRVAPAPAAPDSAWLLEAGAGAVDGIQEQFAVASTHAPGCACCLPRGAAAQALGRLYLRRARGETGWFARVDALCVTPAGAAAVRAALREDVLAAARFRLA